MLYAKHSWKNYLVEEGKAQPEAQAGCPQACTYTIEEAHDLFKDFNTCIEQTFIFPWQIEPYKENRFIKEPWFHAMPYELFQHLQSKLGWNLLVHGVLKNEV